MASVISARVAGLSFLVYIAAGIASLALTQAASAGDDVTAKLASMAANDGLLRYAALLDLLCAFCALTLGATLFALTSAHGSTVAMLAMVFRVVEGVLVASTLSDSMDVLWLAGEPDNRNCGALLLASYVMRSEVALTSTFFAAGSLLFACLFVRGRLIPAPLAWLGVFASLVLLIALPLQLVGFLNGPMLSAAWLPMLLFEAPLALWLIFRGVRSVT